MPQSSTLISLLSVALLAACAAPPASGPSGPAEGRWQGDEVSFTYAGGQITDLVIHDATCTGDDGCTATYGDKGPGPWPSANGIRVNLADIKLVGSFTTRTQASGAITMGDPAASAASAKKAACCQVIGAWSATWQAGLPGQGGADASGGALDGGGSTGSVGPADWGGGSLGDLHPGPSQPVAPTTGSAALAADQQAAHAELNQLRAAVGAPPIKQDANLAQAAQAHADFYVAHVQKYQASKLSPHSEDESFGAGFTGKTPSARVAKAGFSGPPGAEVMAFSGSPAGAVSGWLATVYHRFPLISPNSELFGYGGAKAKGAATEVMDFSARGTRADDPIIVYPWPGQTGVDTSWSGNEGPQPPPPEGGYPSGPVITARVPGATAWGAHSLEDATGNAVPHRFLDASNDPNIQKFDPKSVALYSNEPLPGGQTYTVRLQVTVAGKQRQLAWTFTTK